MAGFEYRVCYCQGDRVTFVNQHWQGRVQPSDADVATAMKTCPLVWDFLEKAGRDGWDMRGATTQVFQGENQQILYLLRPRPPEESAGKQIAGDSRHDDGGPRRRRRSQGLAQKQPGQEK